MSDNQQIRMAEVISPFLNRNFIDSSPDPSGDIAAALRVAGFGDVTALQDPVLEALDRGYGEVPVCGDNPCEHDPVHVSIAEDVKQNPQDYGL